MIRDYAEFRSGTDIGEDFVVDSRVSSSGNNRVGNSLTLRYHSILTRGVDICDGIYVCPSVITNNHDFGMHQIGGSKNGKEFL